MSRAGRARPVVPSPSSRPFPWLLGALGVAFVVLALPFASHTIDDAWITFRYSLQWASGHGPTFNPGEHVEGYSNFLWMALLTPVAALAGPGAVAPVAKALGLVCALSSVAAAFVLARRLARGPGWENLAGAAAAGLVACSPGFSYHAMSGLETAFFGALLAWGVVGLTSERARGEVLGGVSLAAAAVTRPEGPLVWAVAMAMAMVTRALVRPPAADAAATTDSRATDWRPLWIAGAIGAAAILGQLAFRFSFYDGQWLPNTYHAKTGGSGDRFAYVLGALRSSLLRDTGMVLGVFGLVFPIRHSRMNWLVLVVGVTGALLPLAMGSDWMPGGRFIVPYLPLLAAMVVLGWGRLLAKVVRGHIAVVRALLLLAVALAFAAGLGERSTLARSADAENKASRTGHAALASWLRERARPDDTVLLMDIGQVGYRCIEQRILDVTGLTDRHIAQSPGTFLDKNFDLAYVFDQKPEFIVLSFLTRGTGDQPYDPFAPLHPFSAMERRLASHPEFIAHYPTAPTAPASSSDPLEQIRQMVGAEAVFPYAPLGPRYLMAVYRRR